MQKSILIASAVLLVPAALPALAVAAPRPPIYVYCSVGDNQWVSDWPPVDSPQTVDALFDWLARTHNCRRMYWRGEQDRRHIENHHFRRENLLYYDWWTNWVGHLTNDVRTDELAIAAARRHGMQIFVFDALFDHGSHGDSGGCGKFPYSSQDRLCAEHPEWLPVDRWGERTASGPIEFCYPEARAALIKEYMKGVMRGYDGISFYTYVENMALRYADEFGFNEPIVQEFKRRFGVDIRTEAFDKEAWYRLRGEYLTQFLRELHTALAAAGKKLSITLRPNHPNIPQQWLCLAGEEGTGAGMVWMDWERWVQEGVVDEVFAWVGGDTKPILDKAIPLAQGKPVEIVTYSSSPFGEHWNPYREQGVSICSVASPGYGIDPWATEATTAESLRDPDWRVRAQALADCAAGKLTLTAEQITALARDPHVLVRREAIRTLAATGAADRVAVIEAALEDPESSVRIAAATGLGKVNGPDTPAKLLAALNRDAGFQMKEAVLVTLGALKDRAMPAAQEGMDSDRADLRALWVRALAAMGGPQAQAAILGALRDPAWEVRYWAVSGLGNVTAEQSGPAILAALADPDVAVQTRAVQVLEDIHGGLPQDVKDRAFAVLQALFGRYGDGSQRSDRDWGWRAVGNAMVAISPRGREVLEALRTGTGDKWLAWLAYEVLYVRQHPGAVLACTEERAVADHAAFAPPFPGRR